MKRLKKVVGGGGGGTWHEPLRIAQYVGVSLLYFLGLLAFHTHTGLLQIDNHQPAYTSEQARHFISEDRGELILFRHLLAIETNSSSDNGTKKQPDPLFPDDIFSQSQRMAGAVVLHILGVVYMFVALAIVCDEFFVPSLDVIIEVIGCSEDVAGATFMAAGGSAPELFTSVIGVFVAFSDVGIGTIVGSAVFNILFVIGMCALFSKTVLNLTWWPLFRDCTFYSISLITLIIFFRDEFIQWYEALLLLLEYVAYVTFMKFNAQSERLVKRLLYKNKVTRVRSTDHLVPGAEKAAAADLEEKDALVEVHVMVYRGPAATERRSHCNGDDICKHHSAAAALAGVTGAALSGVVAGEGRHHHTGIPMLHSGTHFRHGLLQLMIHTIDPLHDGKVDEKATQLHAIASLKVLLDATKPQDGIAGANGIAIDSATGVNGANNVVGAGDSGRASQGTEVTHVDAYTNAEQLSQTGQNGQQQQINGQQPLPPPQTPVEVSLEEPPQPLDLSWPGTWRERITYIIFLPIILPLWLTLPDCRKTTARKFYPVTFIGSILWIAGFSYLMVWWATITGETFAIPPPVMGLTFLAAGTSIPDLITSVIVARKGFGDMAVSSSVGSNIFDVTVGLPLPWLLYTLIFGEAVPVSATGMVCSICILFGMLVLVFFSILMFNWRMTKGMGFLMFVLYFAFVAVSLGFEYGVYSCPMSLMV